MLHVMVDIETLGVGNNAALLSIGAVKFDTEKLGIEAEFYTMIDPISCQQYGMEIEAGTVMWWMQPEQDEARAAYMAQKHDQIDVASALDGFARWIQMSDPTGVKAVWGNGSNFDNVILRNAYAAIDAECPWQFWEDRCYRTVKNLRKDIPMKREGMYHNALDDARSQALHLQTILLSMGLTDVG